MLLQHTVAACAMVASHHGSRWKHIQDAIPFAWKLWHRETATFERQLHISSKAKLSACRLQWGFSVRPCGQEVLGCKAVPWMCLLLKSLLCAL